jgi:hypothetical protein
MNFETVGCDKDHGVDHRAGQDGPEGIFGATRVDACLGSSNDDRDLDPFDHPLSHPR